MSGPDGEVRRLEPKVMDVFVCLAAGATDLVMRKELLGVAWNGNPAFEKQLTRAIGEIRQALDDDPNDPKYIETVPKRGYRLMTQVRVLDSTGLKEKLSVSYISPLIGKYKLGLAVVALLAIAFAYVFVDEFSAEPARSGGETDVSAHVGGSNAEDNPVISLAVLPFANLSGDPDNEYFSDGLSEEILNLVARIPGVKVIGRASSFSFKGRDVTLRDIGEELGVEMVIEGSVRKSDDRVRITAQLINVPDGAQLWSETYERTMDDIFAIQDEVAAAIFDALHIRIGNVPVRGRPTDSAEAYVLFLRAKAAFNTFERRDTEALLQQAVETDPAFAEAYELLAFNYWTLIGDWLDAAEGQTLVREAAASAVSIDPDLVLAQALYQATAPENNLYLTQLAAFEQVIREQPNHPEALNALAFSLLGFGYFEEALRLAERYVDLDPLSLIANWRLSDALYANGRTSEAMSVWEIINQLDPRGEDWMFAVLNLIEGRDDIAIEGYESFLQRHDFLRSDFPDSSWVSDLVTRARDPATGVAYLDRRIPQIVDDVPEEYAFGWRLMLIEFYLYLGYLDRYFEVILESDLATPALRNVIPLVWIGTKFRRLGFTAHPRYLDVAESLGITEVWEQRGPPDHCEKVNGGWVCD